MVVLEVEIENVALAEFKGEPPVAIHPNCPSALICTFEQMKAIARAFKIFNLVGRLQCCKLKTKLATKEWLNAGGFARFKELAKPFVPKALDHKTNQRRLNRSVLRNRGRYCRRLPTHLGQADTLLADSTGAGPGWASP